jgi:hypothetical protein
MTKVNLVHLRVLCMQLGVELLTSLISHNQYSGAWPESFRIKDLKRDQILGKCLQICYFVTLKKHEADGS